MVRSSHRMCPMKKSTYTFRKIHRQTLVPEQPEAWNFIKKETLAQEFFCEF